MKGLPGQRMIERCANRHAAGYATFHEPASPGCSGDASRIGVP
jgi:hypothetical protein